MISNNPHESPLTITNSNNGTSNPLGFNYAEHVSYVNSNDAITVSASGENDFSASYDFSTYSYVAEATQGGSSVTYNNGNVNVCNAWTREGKARIKLLVDPINFVWTEDNTVAVESGDYSAYVVVTITVGS